ncbi:hypothetical protein FQN50_000322 [Emmonsiellopsis sp. PD_5]|nr:hypothetical protein FQN50_000322 [Emmonsiellopsis sp. PD_5]
MVLRRQLSQGPHPSGGQDDSPYLTPSSSSPFASTEPTLPPQGTPSSTAAGPASAGPYDAPSSNIRYDEMPNPWTQNFPDRPISHWDPPQQTGHTYNQPFQSYSQNEGTVEAPAAPFGRHGEGNLTAAPPHSQTERPKSPPVDINTPSPSSSPFRSNNPFLRAKQTNTSLRKPSTSSSSQDPFDFPQSGGIHNHQNGIHSSTESPKFPLGDDGISHPVLPPLYPDNNPQTGANCESHDIRSTGPGSEAYGDKAMTSGPQPTVTPPSDLFHLSDGVVPESHNVDAKGKSPALLFSDPTYSSSFPNLIDLEETLPTEQHPSDKKPHPVQAVRSLLDEDAQSLPTTLPGEDAQPSAVQLPSNSELEGKLSETYDIRQINWTDGTTKLRQSPVLIQNENGPCPLLALVNGLIMRAKVDSQSPITKALQSRERISLGLLMQALFDELTSYIDGGDQLPDVEALSSFLIMLHTGMNVNPELVLTNYPWNTPGTFCETNDTRLYSSFKLPLVHGWLASPSSPAHAALLRVAHNHDDIQLLHFRKEELEDKVIRGESLTPDEEKLMEDIDTIQHFVNVENPTQLSHFGLQHLEKTLEPGSISILFRNDHFSTLFKHPFSNQLFTLVTDAGYAGHAEIVWENLVDVNGSNSEFFSGDFRPVGNSPQPSSATQPGRQRAATTSGVSGHETGTDPGAGKSTHHHTEQTDADYAFALALQFQDEEEQRRGSNTQNNTQHNTQNQAHNHAARRPSGSAASFQTQGVTQARSGSTSTRGHRHSTSSSAAGRRGSRQPVPVRSLVPPQAPAADPNDPNAPPPTYEQAAQSPAYIPPSGHAQFDGSNHSIPDIAGPRSSSYGFTQNPVINHDPYQHGGRRPYSTSNNSLPPRPRDRDKNKDCIVM